MRFFRMSSLHVCGAATGFEPSTCGQRTDVCVCVVVGGWGVGGGVAARVGEGGRGGRGVPRPLTLALTSSLSTADMLSLKAGLARVGASSSRTGVSSRAGASSRFRRSSSRAGASSSRDRLSCSQAAALGQHHRHCDRRSRGDRRRGDPLIRGQVPGRSRPRNAALGLSVGL